MPSNQGERAFFDAFDPSSETAERHLVLGFAGNGAGVATDAPSVIDHKAIGHAQSHLFDFSNSRKWSLSSDRCNFNQMQETTSRGGLSKGSCGVWFSQVQNGKGELRPDLIPGLQPICE
jgi:hypothetical protein